MIVYAWTNFVGIHSTRKSFHLCHPSKYSSLVSSFGSKELHRNTNTQRRCIVAHACTNGGSQTLVSLLLTFPYFQWLRLTMVNIFIPHWNDLFSRTLKLPHYRITAAVPKQELSAMHFPVDVCSKRVIVSWDPSWFLKNTNPLLSWALSPFGLFSAAWGCWAGSVSLFHKRLTYRLQDFALEMGLLGLFPGFRFSLAKVIPWSLRV